MKEKRGVWTRVPTCVFEKRGKDEEGEGKEKFQKILIDKRVGKRLTQKKK